jgi:hypothetical protein
VENNGKKKEMLVVQMQEEKDALVAMEAGKMECLWFVRWPRA